MSFNKLQSLNLIEQNLGGLGQAVNEIQAIDNIASKLGVGGTIRSGNTFIPVASVLVNVTSTTFFPATFMRVLNMVIMTGVFNLQVTAAGGWSFEVSLPIPSNFVTVQDMGGAAITNANNVFIQQIRNTITTKIGSFIGNATGASPLGTATYILGYPVLS